MRARDQDPSSPAGILRIFLTDAVAVVGVGAGVDRVVQYSRGARDAQRTPARHGVRAAPAVTAGKWLTLILEVTGHRGSTAEPFEAGEEQLHRISDPLVGVQPDLALLPHVAHRQADAKGAPTRLVASPTDHPALQEMQLRFAQGPLQPQQQPVVVVIRVVDAVLVHDQGPRQSRHFQ